MQSNVEKWKIIELYNKYEISTHGRIRNKKTKRVLKTHQRNGYNTITICNKTIAIHRYVAITYIENINNYKYVNHIDGNKLNNIVNNLEWITQKNNVIHSVQNNLIIPYTRSVKQYSLDDEFIQEFQSVTIAAKNVKCHRRSIDKVCKGENVTAKGFKWKYSTDTATCDLSNAKIITEFPQYKITNFGEIYSIRTKRSMKLQQNKNGYLWVQLCINKQKKNLYVHQIVAQYFIENINKKSFVNHIDGNKTNNNVQNLEWVTQSENNIHYINLKKSLTPS